ncbi:MAG: prephenate dehydrogenase/arogenate dehydrogenase family protein [Thermoanaerobaculum sp.]|nr:prephenate dehydrogenase/arogenate dehydrogenase family protein [Thermoanaerobaculum sp.]MDW7968656.1 chorismate mutase [Thermoanaerobaculum sp.]
MDLSQLRDAIADVDRALCELLRRRMELAARIGELKAQLGVPVVVRDVEDRVLSRARLYAETCGVSPEVMEAIFSAIIRGSVERQHRVGVALRRGRGQRVLVVGGAGAMGNWFRNFLALVGHQVDAVDPAWSPLPPSEGTYASLTCVPLHDYAYILVSVPLALTPDVLLDLGRRKPAGVVVEIASIKTHLEGALKEAEAQGVRVLSLHPMFGPGKSPYQPLTFVLASRQDPEAEQQALLPLLRHPYTHLVPVPFPHHDRLMGWLLGLAHLTGLLFGRALAASGLAPAQLLACASTTFLKQAATAASVLSEDPDLYLDIQRLNPHRRQVYEVTRQSLEHLVQLVEAGDREGFRQLMQDARGAVPEVDLRP